MSYRVLARKWRPGSFAQVAGQEHVIRTLTNALELGRLHHAYLFTGTRGVGKTTIARILARCLNCDKGLTAEPCGECPACREISQGRFIDLIEVDAASRTGVDNMRELLDNVKYPPSSGRCKVYLIDEVHMLSISSFNALLKTLEEPPDHVKFLFATTNPQKIPLTILSRCLQLNLKRLPDATISEYLAGLLQNEGIEHEQKALNEIVVAAEGSMRDALSLLDQAIAYGNGALKTDAVDQMLGVSSREHTVRLLQCVVRRDAAGMVETVDRLYRHAADFLGVVNDFIDLLHQVALRQALPQAAVSPRFDAGEVDALAREITPEDLQLAYQIALSGKRDMPLVGDDKNAVEMTLLRIINFTPLQAAATPRPAARPAAQAGAQSEPQARPRPAPATGASPQPGDATGGEPAAGENRGGGGGYELSSCSGVEEWIKLIEQMQLKGSVREICYHSLITVHSPSAAELLIDESAMAICSDEDKRAINDALNRVTGETVKLEFKVSNGAPSPAQIEMQNKLKHQHKAQVAVENDPSVVRLKEEFNASILADSTSPVETES